MNVIIANRYQSMLQGINIDVIKVLNGKLKVKIIIIGFQIFYFQRLLIVVIPFKVSK